MTIDPKTVSTAELHSFLLGGVAPRPIALVSTVDKEGNPNLSPYSFFNVFSANPPLAIFSPARRVRDNTTKHTLENALATKEAVINIVNYPIVEQVSLSSTEYGEGVNEFTKAGLTMLPSEVVSAPRVTESPMQLECKVREVIGLGENPGAGNLVLCEIVRVHVRDEFVGQDGKLLLEQLDLVGRMGGNFYCRTTPSVLFEVEKPLRSLGIGFDALPQEIKESNILTGNLLARMANVDKVPSLEEALSQGNIPEEAEHDTQEKLHMRMKISLEKGDSLGAWSQYIVWQNQQK